MRAFEYHAPTSLDEAVALLREHGANGRAIAGGTDIVVQMKEGRTRFPYPAYVVEPDARAGAEGHRVQRIRRPAHRRHRHDDRRRRVTRNPRATTPPWPRALASSARYQTMNMATIGGNVCNAAPSADTAPAASGVRAPRRDRRDRADAGRYRSRTSSDWARADGARRGRTARGAAAPAPAANTGIAYQRHTPRKQMDIAVVGVARRRSPSTAARSGAPASRSAPSRRRRSVRRGRGRAAKAARRRREAFAKRARRSPRASAARSRTLRGSAEFRRHLVRVMTERMLTSGRESAKETMPKQLITLNINGETHEVAVEPRWTLLETVREKAAPHRRQGRLRHRRLRRLLDDRRWAADHLVPDARRCRPTAARSRRSRACADERQPRPRPASVHRQRAASSAASARRA